jgi:Flp pilus assembly protein TadB
MTTPALLAVGASAASVALAVPGRRTLAAGEQRPPRSGRVGDEPPWLRLTGTVSVTAGVLFLVGGPAGILLCVVAAAACWWATGRMEPPAVRRRREQVAAGVPHAVDLLAACLAVGLSPGAALEQVTAALGPPVSDELSEVVSRLRMGVDPVTVWRDLAGHPQLGGLGRSVARAVESGASVAEAMQRLADDLRRQGRAEVESRARAVGVKAAVPLGVCLLPAFVLVGVVPLVAGSVSVLAGR